MREEAEPTNLINGKTNRRGALRRMLSVGVFTTVGAGLAELAAVSSARAATTQLPITMVLNALPPDASPTLREAIQSGCCTTYTVDEFHCGSGGCGAGWCCYHVVSVNCGINEVVCINVGCNTGNFSTGC